MITAYDNKLLPGHLTLLEPGDLLVSHPPCVSRFDLTIDDFETIPAASFVLIFDATTIYLHDENVYITALVSDRRGAYCCRFNKNTFANLKFTNDKHL